MSHALRGRLADGIDELTVELARLEGGAKDDAARVDLSLGRGVLRMWAGDLGGAADDLAACLVGGAGGTLVARETARYSLAELHYRAGRWDAAVVAAEVAAADRRCRRPGLDRSLPARGGGLPARGPRRVGPGRGPPAGRHGRHRAGGRRRRPAVDRVGSRPPRRVPGRSRERGRRVRPPGRGPRSALRRGHRRLAGDLRRGARRGRAGRATRPRSWRGSRTTSGRARAPPPARTWPAPGWRWRWQRAMSRAPRRPPSAASRSPTSRRPCSPVAAWSSWPGPCGGGRARSTGPWRRWRRPAVGSTGWGRRRGVAGPRASWPGRVVARPGAPRWRPR